MQARRKGGGGRTIYHCAKFSQKGHENKKKILEEEGARVENVIM